MCEQGRGGGRGETPRSRHPGLQLRRSLAAACVASNFGNLFKMECTGGREKVPRGRVPGARGPNGAGGFS